MATLLKKTVSREMLSSVVGHGKHRNRPVIVELLAGDELNFRVKGTRTSYKIYLGHCFRLAQIQTEEERYKAALATYTERKKAGAKKLRKPRRHALPFSNIYLKALNK